MKHLFSLLLCVATAGLSAQSPADIHQKAILIDTHNDVLSSAVLDGVDISHRVAVGHSDLDRWKEGGLDVQFFSVWTGASPRTPEGFFHDAVAEIDSLQRLVDRNPGRMVLARRYKEVRKGIKKGELVALIGVEGGHMIEADLDKLQQLYNLGMRYLTLTWNNSNAWASSAMDETLHPEQLKQKGLTEFGRQVVRRMNDLGIMVDLSHTGEQTFYDAIAESRKPVLVSHSSVWNLCPVFRNLKDDQIRAVAKNGGVICINFYAGFISRKFDEAVTYYDGDGGRLVYDSIKAAHAAMNDAGDTSALKAIAGMVIHEQLKAFRPTIAELVDHIDYIVKLVGDDYVGIGSDFDGVGSLPIGMDDVTCYPKVTAELLRRGYAVSSINKILGGNVLRVMRANFRK